MLDSTGEEKAHEKIEYDVAPLYLLRKRKAIKMFPLLTFEDLSVGRSLSIFHPTC